MRSRIDGISGTWLWRLLCSTVLWLFYSPVRGTNPRADNEMGSIYALRCVSFLHLSVVSREWEGSHISLFRARLTNPWWMFTLGLFSTLPVRSRILQRNTHAVPFYSVRCNASIANAQNRCPRDQSFIVLNPYKVTEPPSIRDLSSIGSLGDLSSSDECSRRVLESTGYLELPLTLLWLFPYRPVSWPARSMAK